MPSTFVSFYEKCRDAVQEDLRRRVERTTHRYEEILQGEFREPKTGREYKRGEHIHVASAPGEPPAVDSAGLSQSVTHEIVPAGEIGWVSRVGVAAEAGTYVQAITLELGGENVDARPAWRPALERLRSDVPDLMSKGGAA